MLIDPAQFNVAEPAKLLKLMLMTFLFAGLTGVWAYLRQSPLPAIVEEETTTTTLTRSEVTTIKPHDGIDLKILLLCASLAGLTGCVTSANPDALPRRVGNAVYLGTVVYLQERPQDRLRIEDSERILGAIEAGISPAEWFPEVINQDHAIYAALFAIAIDEIEAAGIKLDTPEAVKKWIAPLRNGLNRALGQ